MIWSQVRATCYVESADKRQYPVRSELDAGDPAFLDEDVTLHSLGEYRIRDRIF